MLGIQQSIRTALCVGLVMATGLLARAQESVPEPVGEWHYYGGDKGFTRYSPLDQINLDNVGDLEILWRRPKVDPQLRQAFPDLAINDNLRSTPIMVGGVLYAPNGVGLVEAFDAGTGKTVWEQEPFDSTPEGMSGSSSRGLDYWESGTDRRVFVARRRYLYALNARTGAYYPDFGENGRVDLHRDLPWAEYSWSIAAPVVVGDVVVVAGNGGGGGDFGNKKEAAPEDVRGYDVRTGELVWTFHVRPRPGEFGDDTWGDSWWYGGAMGAWGGLSADEELGYVYVPLTAPSNSLYGGHRPGDNLYADSLVAIDAKTGKRVWHFQMVHHDLWDYDNIGAPVLGNITVDGKQIKAVMQPNKTGFVYVFDRETGEPVWPIEERPVPQSTVPGERTSPTQPFPTKPAPFDRQGLTEDDLIDFTPELRAEALRIMNQYVTGPIFTPPSLADEAANGTIVVPGTWGAANWHTPAFDPETGVFYAASHTLPYINDMVAATGDATMDYVIKSPPPGAGRGWRQSHQELATPFGLPLTKPPYGRLTAIDMNQGEHVWQVAVGDGPRDHPLLRDLDLPPLGIANRAAPLVTKTMLFIGEGSDAMPGVARGAWGTMFRALNKATGETIWEMQLPAGATSAPMTYLDDGKQYVVVAVGGRDYPAEWVALGLP